MFHRAVLVLVAGVLFTHTFIDLELAADIGGWRANAPIGDLFALLLLAVAAVGWWRDRSQPMAPLPYTVFLCIAFVGAATTWEPGTSLHNLLRKPLFVYLAYGLALSWAVARVIPPRRLERLVLAALTLIATVSIATSSGRILAGDSLWFHELGGITSNHKTLAVALSGWLAWTLSLRQTRAGLVVSGLIVLAIALSASKTALIATGFAIAWWFPRQRPIAMRPAVLLALLALAYGAAMLSPMMIRSRAMLDAARSRHSLNMRAVEMVERSPLFGDGSGMSTEIELVTFPHYRVNGVDAHGVIQKVASETGLLGLAAYLWFLWVSTAVIWRRWDRIPGGPRYAHLGCWAGLHLNLLLSTETFSPTHWVPLSVMWGLSQREQA